MSALENIVTGLVTKSTGGGTGGAGVVDGATNATLQTIATTNHADLADVISKLVALAAKIPALGAAPVAGSLPVTFPPDQTISILLPSEQSAYPSGQVVKNVTLYDPANPGLQSLFFGAVGPKTITIGFKQGSAGVDTNFLKVALNAYGPYDANGRFTTNSNAIVVPSDGAVNFTIDANSLLSRIDFSLDTAKGAEANYVYITLGF